MAGTGLRSAKVRAVIALATLTVGALFALPAHAINPGEALFADANDDGYVNIDEYANLEAATKSVPVHWMSPGADYDGASDTTTGSFRDDASVILGGCGPYNLGTSTNTSGAGYLNATCAASFPDGATIHWVVTWDDVDGPAPDVTDEDTIVKDITAPTASITLAAGADNKVATPEANAGVPVTWSVSGTGPGVTVRAANDGQPSPGACIWGGLPRATTGAITAACFAALVDGPIDVIVTGSDDASNGVSASDPTTLTLDRVGDLPAPVVSFLNAPINSANVGAVQVKITGTANAPYSLSVDDVTNVPATVAVAAPNGTLSATGVATVTVNLTSLNDGQIVATAKLFDTDGNPSTGTATTTKDIVIPGKPLIFSPAMSSLNNAGVLKASGAAEIGTRIQIWVDKSPLPPVKAIYGDTSPVVDANGAWTVALPTRTPHLGFGESGTYKIYAVAIDANGNVSLPSDTVTFDLDIDLPLVFIDAPANQSIIDHGAPVIISGTAAETNDQAFAKLFAVELDVFSPITPDANAKLVPNTAEPLKTTYTYQIALGKSVFKKNANCKGTDVAQTPCGLAGPHDAVWSYDLSFLPPGPYTVQVRALDLSGNWSAQLSQVNFIRL